MAAEIASKPVAAAARRGATEKEHRPSRASFTSFQAVYFGLPGESCSSLDVDRNLRVADPCA